METAFMDVSRKVGGEWLFQAMGIILIIANIGCGLSAQTGVARLLYGMGREGALPGRRLFAHLDAKSGSPSYNVAFVGGLSCLGAFLLNYEQSAELINFGAFLAFMGVNAAVIRHSFKVHFSEPGHRIFSGVLLPAFGFLFCLSIWLNLSRPAKITGGIWFLVGLAFHFARRRRGVEPVINFE
jgi:putrescine importer